MAEFSEQTSLHEKMASVMLAIGGISKSGKNSHQNYAFIKHSDVFAKVQELLGSHGIAMYSNVIGYELLPTDKGTHVILQMKFILACQDTGQTMECLWVGESKDSSDKAFNKAMTAGMKYFLLTTFLIASDEAKDADSESPSTGRPPTQQRTAPTPKTTEPKVWTKAQAGAFWNKWNKVQAIADETILKALGGIGKLGDWQGTAEQAEQAMTDYIERIK